MFETSSNRRLFLRANTGIAGTALTSMIAREKLEQIQHISPKDNPTFRQKQRVLSGCSCVAVSAIWKASTQNLHSINLQAKPSLKRPTQVYRLPKTKACSSVVVNDANGQQRNKIYPLQVGYQPYGESESKSAIGFPTLAPKWMTFRSFVPCGQLMTTTELRCSFIQAGTCWIRGYPRSEPGSTMDSAR